MYKYIPNILSIYRIATAPFLVILILLEEENLFKWLLLVSLISDILDGLIARTFHLQSELGARLDSIGDMSTYLVALFGIFIFQKPFIDAHLLSIGSVLGLYILQNITALIKFQRITSFHTTLTRVTAYMQGIFIMTLFLFGFQKWMFYPTVFVSLFAYSEEIALNFILPQLQSDVGGLIRVLKNRSS